MPLLPPRLNDFGIVCGSLLHVAPRRRQPAHLFNCLTHICSTWRVQLLSCGGARAPTILVGERWGACTPAPKNPQGGHVLTPGRKGISANNLHTRLYACWCYKCDRQSNQMSLLLLMHLGLLLKRQTWCCESEALCCVKKSYVYIYLWTYWKNKSNHLGSV